jgi:hypothetical protein
VIRRRLPAAGVVRTVTRSGWVLACSIGVLGSLAALAGQAAPESPGDQTPAWRRHQEEVYLGWLRMRDPKRRTGRSDLDTLTIPALRERLQPVVRDLSADLADPSLSARDRQSTLEAMTRLGELARSASPAIVTLLEVGDRTKGSDVARFCTVTRTLAAVDPRSPHVVEALAKALDAELGRRGVCHRCGCVLDALREAGPAARTIAGPVLERAASGRLITTYPNQLGRALEAVGIGGATRSVLARVENPDVLPDDRAASLRALAGSFATLPADEQNSIRQAASRLLTHNVLAIRLAAAEALGSTGAPAVGALTGALGDAHYQVRAAAAGSLGKTGAAALPASGALIDALDPFLGTAAPAGRALVAIGPEALPDVRARAGRAAPPLRPLVTAAEEAIRTGKPALVDAALSRHFTAGPNGRGYVRIDSLAAGAGMPFDPQHHRMRFRFRWLGYGAANKPPAITEGRITAKGAPNVVFAALRGQREGAHLRLLLSAEVAESPFFATTRHSDSWQTAEVGSPIHLDVSIEDVCEPVVWRLFKGSGIVGEMKISLYCRG